MGSRRTGPISANGSVVRISFYSKIILSIGAAFTAMNSIGNSDDGDSWSLKELMADKFSSNKAVLRNEGIKEEKPT